MSRLVTDPLFRQPRKTPTKRKAPLHPGLHHSSGISSSAELEAMTRHSSPLRRQRQDQMDAHRDRAASLRAQQFSPYYNASLGRPAGITSRSTSASLIETAAENPSDPLHTQSHDSTLHALPVKRNLIIAFEQSSNFVGSTNEIQSKRRRGVASIAGIESALREPATEPEEDECELEIVSDVDE